MDELKENEISNRCADGDFWYKVFLKSIRPARIPMVAVQ